MTDGNILEGRGLPQILVCQSPKLDQMNRLIVAADFVCFILYRSPFRVVAFVVVPDSDIVGVQVLHKKAEGCLVFVVNDICTRSAFEKMVERCPHRCVFGDDIFMDLESSLVLTNDEQHNVIWISERLISWLTRPDVSDTYERNEQEYAGVG